MPLLATAVHLASSCLMVLTLLLQILLGFGSLLQMGAVWPSKKNSTKLSWHNL